jgi:hypothetical protein
MRNKIEWNKIQKMYWCSSVKAYVNKLKSIMCYLLSES